jgi:hypothetical protein
MEIPKGESRGVVERPIASGKQLANPRAREGSMKILLAVVMGAISGFLL